MKQIAMGLPWRFLIILTILLVIPSHLQAAELFRGKVTELSDKQVKVVLLEGDQKGNTFSVLLFDEKQLQTQGIQKGDEVLTSFLQTPDGKKQLTITDQVRLMPLGVLFALFFGVVAFIGRKKGLLSFIAMGFSFVVIAKLIVPQIILGNNPLLISLIASILIIPSSFYLSHGISTKTTIAVLGTFLTLAITGVLAFIFVSFAKLTGYAAEEATFITTNSGSTISIQGLLLAGIVIGAMGVLDDITISQTSIVGKLRKANPKYTKWELFRESMDVGRDHIASLVNTLVLVYAGVALPLFVLFSSTQFGTFWQVLNMEIVATEIVRTLVASIGIVSAVPITTLMAVWWGRE